MRFFIGILLMFWSCGIANKKEDITKDCLDNVNFADTIFPSGRYFQYEIIKNACYLSVGDKNKDGIF